MKRILIIEDESHAAEHLQRLLNKIDKSLEVVAHLKSGAESIAWLTENPTPDLIFLDIQLSDGISFSIFDRVEVEAPIIFTTAYDQYALRAFKLNSIDYLLKPYTLEDLTRATSKWRKLHKDQYPRIGKEELQAIVNSMQTTYKQRFLVKAGHQLKSIKLDEISFFMSQDKITYLVHVNGRRYAVDYSLTDLESIVDPQRFFRINRNHIISHKAIDTIVSYSNSRLKVTAKPTQNNPYGRQ